jgi:hypothetical protein
MPKPALLAAVAAALLAAPHVAGAQGYSQHRGYFTDRGTYVQPHVQTSPNTSRFDNWSTRGNTNPFTGQAGTVDPYRVPTPSYGGGGYGAYGGGYGGGYGTYPRY